MTPPEGSKLEAITSQFGLQKIIKEPTHLIGNNSLYMNLIFTPQQNPVMEPGVFASTRKTSNFLQFPTVLKIYQNLSKY